VHPAATITESATRWRRIDERDEAEKTNRTPALMCPLTHLGKRFATMRRR